MKYILELILATIVIFFVWNILKRIFLNKFYKNFHSVFNQTRADKKTETSEKKLNKKVNWDAETVDYEEVKEVNNTNK